MSIVIRVFWPFQILRSVPPKTLKPHDFSFQHALERTCIDALQNLTFSNNTKSGANSEPA